MENNESQVFHCQLGKLPLRKGNANKHTGMSRFFNISLYCTLYILRFLQIEDLLSKKIMTS